MSNTINLPCTSVLENLDNMAKALRRNSISQWLRASCIDPGAALLAAGPVQTLLPSNQKNILPRVLTVELSEWLSTGDAKVAEQMADRIGIVANTVRDLITLSVPLFSDKLDRYEKLNDADITLLYEMNLDNDLQAEIFERVMFYNEDPRRNREALRASMCKVRYTV